MKAIYALTIAAAAAAAGISAAYADDAGGTTRPSYDMPRAYDRDTAGNETYRYQSVPGSRTRHVKKHYRHYDD